MIDQPRATCRSHRPEMCPADEKDSNCQGFQGTYPFRRAKTGYYPHGEQDAFGIISFGEHDAQILVRDCQSYLNLALSRALMTCGSLTMFLCSFSDRSAIYALTAARSSLFGYTPAPQTLTPNQMSLRDPPPRWHDLASFLHPIVCWGTSVGK